MRRVFPAARRIEECAAGVGAETVPLPEHAIKEIKIQHKTIDFSLHLNYYDYIGFTVSMPAVYQAENVLYQLPKGAVQIIISPADKSRILPVGIFQYRKRQGTLILKHNQDLTDMADLMVKIVKEAKKAEIQATLDIE